jgi:hypothetical protein
MPDLFAQPPRAPHVALPQEAPNRPLGKDWLSDAVDALLGGVGISNPMTPGASSATQLGGMLSAALPLSKLGKAAQDLKDGFTLPQAKNALSDTRMGEFLAAHGGTAGAPPMALPSVQPSLAAMGAAPPAAIAPSQATLPARPPGPWDQNTRR